MNGAALSELGVTEFLTLQRAGFLPRGLVWRGARQVAKYIAVGTAVVFDRTHAPHALTNAPSCASRAARRSTAISLAPIS